MMVDKKYCMSSFLMFRTIADNTKSFGEGNQPNLWEDCYDRKNVHDSWELEKYLEDYVVALGKEKKVALALSGGIDSAILAKFMPKGSIAYTFKCVVPGVDVTDETVVAKQYAEECGLEHRVIEIYWEDFEKYAPILMKHKGAPIHSIEVQIYKAALQAKEDGVQAFIFGESSDLNYGGLSGLLSKDWTVGEFVDRYSYVKPNHALKDFEVIIEPYLQYEKDGKINVHEFNRGFFMREAMGSYTNACECAKIRVEMPYAHTKMAVPLNMDRIRSGQNKYLVREVFHRLYPGFGVPPKTPMPRPMNEWLKDWEGPHREEFWPHCTDNMTGDQKWLVWALEKFLDMNEEK